MRTMGVLWVVVVLSSVLLLGTGRSEAALPFNEQWRLDMIPTCQGFGCSGWSTVDFSTWSLCTVTNLNDSGTGSLRACVNTAGGQWIIFAVSGEIILSSTIQIPANRAIDGRGANIMIRNANTTFSGALLEVGIWSSNYGPANNILIENVKIGRVNGNAALIIGDRGESVWVDHVTFQNSIDELLGVDGADDAGEPVRATISWCHFLLSDSTPVPSNIYGITTWADHGAAFSSSDLPRSTNGMATLHHNRFGVLIRNPILWDMKLHGFNNFYEGLGLPTPNAGPNVCRFGHFLSEHEVFQYGGYNPMIESTEYGCGAEPLGVVKVVSPFLLDGATTSETDPTSIFTIPYSYTPDTANATLRTNIIAGAGWQNVSAPVTDPIAYYPLDGTAQDSSGNTLHGTLINAPTYVTGRVGQAVTLNGTTQSVDVADAATLDLTGSFSLAAWVRPSTALTDFAAVVVKNYTYLLYAGSSAICGAGAPVGGVNGGGFACDATPLPATTWTHLAMTYDGSTVRLYRNGIESATAVASVNPTATTGTLQIGASEFGEFFPGAIDEVYVYGRTLSASEVAALANPEGAVAVYAFEGTAQDSSGNTLHGTLIGAPSYTTGRVGQGISLNGTTQSVDVTDATPLDLAGNYSLVAWVKPATPLTSFVAVLVKNYTYFLYASSDGICGTSAVMTGTNGGDLACDATPLASGVWTHLAMTYDGSMVRLYRNGTQAASVTTSVNPTATTGTLQIGASEFGEFFSGVIDEVYVYGRALTGSEVSALANVDVTSTPAPLVLRLGKQP